MTGSLRILGPSPTGGTDSFLFRQLYRRVPRRTTRSGTPQQRSSSSEQLFPLLSLCVCNLILFRDSTALFPACRLVRAFRAVLCCRPPDLALRQSD